MSVLDRRQVLQGGLAFAGWSFIPATRSLAGDRDARLLVVILRGGFDGLCGVLPTFDPHFAKLRGAFVDELQAVGGYRDLDGGFALPVQLKALHRLYQKNEALFLHAIASPYRGRSHFDGQDVLETGYAGTGKRDSGWLNRALTFLKADRPVGTNEALGVGRSAPLILQGQNRVLSWYPQLLPLAGEDVLQRLLRLYDARDPDLGAALQRGIALDREVGAGSNMGAWRRSQSELTLAAVSGATKLIAKPDGPRISALSLDGWDTHIFQRPGTGKFSRLLELTDAVVTQIESNLKPVWRDTVVVMVTEFGRTVAINGSHGTDHGTASASILFGGAVNGGRVVADWPGLSPGKLFEGRDLHPTRDLRGTFKGILTDHFDVPGQALEAVVFPDSPMAPAERGLIRS